MLPRFAISFLFLSIAWFGLSACTTTVKAVRLSPGEEPTGIPYYLPKPYLVLAKNVRYIPAATVGLTNTAPIPDSFDSSELMINGTLNQSRTTSYQRHISETVTSTTNPNVNLPSPSEAAETPPATPDPENDGGGSDDAGGQPQSDAINGGDEAGTPGAGSSGGNQVLGPDTYPVVPSASIPDGMRPETFYTYNIIYLPDLTQKYGLRIKGGLGETRATLNIVNGWMHTGPGPYYARNSTTAASIAATGMAAGNIVDSLGGLAMAKGAGVPIAPNMNLGGGGEAQALELAARGVHLDSSRGTISDYAQIYVFESVLEDGQMIWREIPEMRISFDRDFIESTVNAPISATAGSVSGTAFNPPEPPVINER